MWALDLWGRFEFSTGVVINLASTSAEDTFDIVMPKSKSSKSVVLELPSCN